MGRSPTVNHNMPKGMRPRRQKSGKVYYYLEVYKEKRTEIPLGDDYLEALKKYAEYKGARPEDMVIVTFKDAMDAYFKSRYFLKLATRTQTDYLACQTKLLEFFNDPPASLESINASNIESFMEWRGANSQRRANYEYSVFSIIWNYARRKGMTNKANPCEGVPKFVLEPRDVYVEDDIYLAIYEMACEPVRDAMDLAYLTGQRPADVFKMDETVIKDETILVKQNKSRKKIRLRIEGDLKVVIDRILARKKKNAVYSLALVCNEKGARITQDAVAKRFRKIRTRVITKYPQMASELGKFQFRDLRAKSATDIYEEIDAQSAQHLLGHSDVKTTDIYIRSINGKEVSPNIANDKIRRAIISRA